MRIKFIPFADYKFKDNEAEILYRLGFEFEMDFRPQPGDQLNLYEIVEGEKIPNKELQKAVMEMEYSLVTSTHIERDADGLYLVAALDEEQPGPGLSFLTGFIDNGDNPINDYLNRNN